MPPMGLWVMAEMAMGAPPLLHQWSRAWPAILQAIGKDGKGRDGDGKFTPEELKKLSW